MSELEKVNGIGVLIYLYIGLMVCLHEMNWSSGLPLQTCCWSNGLFLQTCCWSNCYLFMFLSNTVTFVLLSCLWIGFYNHSQPPFHYISRALLACTILNTVNHVNGCLFFISILNIVTVCRLCGSETVLSALLEGRALIAII